MRLNRKTEFHKSLYLTSRIRGYGNFTSGYKVTQLDDQVVVVTYEHGHWVINQPADQRIKTKGEKLSAYAEWLSQWYDVSRPNGGKGLSLEVRVKS
jgi:hypothetical protein